MLEVEGPTSADAGVASCLLDNAEPVFRRLRDDLLDGKIFDGMIQRGGNELPKRGTWECSRKLRNFRGAGKTGTTGQLLNGKAGVDTIDTKAKTRTFKRKRFLATAT